MRPVILFLVGLVLGGGAYALSQALLTSDDEPAPPEAALMMADLDAMSSSALDKIVVRLDRIERRLDGMTFPVATPADDRPHLVGSPDAKPPAAMSAEPVTIDVDSLEAALEEVEARKWDEMSPAEVKRAAQRMLKQGDATGSEKALERLLGRKIEPELKADVLTQLGMVQRTKQDFEGSEASLREAIRVVGLDSPQGVQAGMQLAWTLSKTEDYPEALRVAEDVIRVPSSQGQLRTNMRWGVGVLSATQGDSVRAREAFEHVIREAQQNPNLEGLAKDAQRRLDQLR